MSNAPKIRFSGYNGEWRQRRFAQAFDVLQNNTLSRADLDLETGIAQDIHYGDVLIKFGEFLDVSETTLPYISSKQTIESFKNSYLQNGDVIMADTAEDETVGKCTEIGGLQGLPTISGLHTIPLRPKDKYASGYLGYYMNSESYHDQLLPLMQGTKVTSVSKTALQSTYISYPLETEEQASIGSLFIDIDKLITLSQREYEKLVSLKDAFLHEMFPQKGSSIPELRFAGFTKQWERHMLHELATFGGGHTPSMADETNYNPSKILWVTSQDVKVNYIEDTTTKISEKGAAELTIYPVGTLLVVTRSGILRHTLPVAMLQKPSTVNQDIRTIQTNKDCSSLWLLQYFKAHSQKMLYEYGKTGTTVESIDFDRMKSMHLLIPEIKEQEAIGKMFYQIDTLITLHQHTLEKLKQLKQAMLHKMLV